MTLSDTARRLVERSCREQGIELAVTDPLALGRIADLLTQEKTPAPSRKAGAREVRRDAVDHRQRSG